jgi:LPS export ABC transporter protein LptC
MIKFLLHKRNYVQAAFLFGCLFFFGCENDEKMIRELTEKKVLVEEAKNIEVYFSQNGFMKAKMNAPLMLRYQADTLYSEFPKSLHCNFFDSTGKVDSHLDALYGKYLESLNKVLLRDSVVVFNMQGDSLRTPELWWDQNTQRFYTDKRVKVRKSGTLIYGKGLEAKQDLSEINIREVTGLVPVPDSLQ